MKGLTNAISQSGGGGGGDTISAVNRTNATIREGDKVWINKDTLASGEHFEIRYKSPQYVFGEISPLGTLAVFCGKVYEIGANSATEIYTIPGSPSSSSYLIQEGNNLFLQDSSSFTGFIRLGNNTAWSNRLINYRYLGNGLAFRYGSDAFIAKIDIETGKVLYQSEVISIDSGIDRCVFINNIFINTIARRRQAWLVNDTGSSIELTPQNPTNALTSDLHTNGLFATSDNKYILGRKSDYGNFKIISYNANTFIEYDMASAFPEFMEWVNSDFDYSFDRDSGLLTFASNTSNSYAVFKYENGKFNKLVVELPSDVSITNFQCQIGITRDMTRISFMNKYAYPNCYLNIASLTNDERYLLQSNAYYNIGETTLTGKANQDIPSGGTGEVTTILAD